ncbi:RNA polymerase sigma factor [Paractinoplanes rishiriensis]|uniref:RNA polymerase sigma factor n=1 Tax=Paractinoplanes rishiriensis TaxID=1050105 RepID=UPI001EF2F421|nr:sigma-70 family RNA polymerase sigma factor [Actinoplanes rishiriensis]
MGIVYGDLASLVRGTIDGDEEGWNQLVRRYAGLVAGVIRRHRIPDADLQDVSQLVWLRLIEHLRQIREPAALPGWIATTTGRECQRWLRANSRSLPVDPETMNRLEAADDRVGDSLLHAERHQVLADALTELEPQQQELFMLLVADPPLTYAEISRMMHIPIGSIGPTRNRILDKLRTSTAVTNYLQANDDVAPTGGGRDAFAGLEQR